MRNTISIVDAYFIRHIFISKKLLSISRSSYHKWEGESWLLVKRRVRTVFDDGCYGSRQEIAFSDGLNQRILVVWTTRGPMPFLSGACLVFLLGLSEIRGKHTQAQQSYTMSRAVGRLISQYRVRHRYISHSDNTLMRQTHIQPDAPWQTGLPVTELSALNRHSAKP